jgi:hypothetical protein
MLKAEVEQVKEIARAIAKEEIALAMKPAKKPVEKDKEPEKEKDKEPEETGSARTQFKKQ